MIQNYYWRTRMKKMFLTLCLVLASTAVLSAATLDRVKYTFLKPAEKAIPAEIKKVYLLFVTENKLSYDLKIMKDLKANPIFSALYEVTGEDVMIVDQAPGKDADWAAIVGPFTSKAEATGCDAIAIIGFNMCLHETMEGRVPMKQLFVNSATGQSISVNVENPAEFFEPKMLGSFSIYDLKSDSVVTTLPMFENEAMVKYEARYIEGVTRFRDLKGGIQASQKGFSPSGSPRLDSQSSMYKNKVQKFPSPESVMTKMFDRLYHGVCYFNLPKEDKETIKLIKFSKGALNKPFKAAMKAEDWAELLKVMEANEATLLGTGKSKDVAAYYYNIAMLNEVAGNYEKALELLQKAEDAETKRISFEDEKVRLEELISLFQDYPQLANL